MGDNLMDKVSAFGERLKISGSEVSQKMITGMSSMTSKIKEFFQGQSEGEKLVEEATVETLEGPDWSTNFEICDMINSERLNSVEVIRGIKNRIILQNSTVQFLVLVLLETCVKNCEKAFSEVAAERVLDEMVKLIDNPQTVVNVRNKALLLIESWGESVDELRYLPVFEETYKSLKSRGICFPERDDESLAPIFTSPLSVLVADPDTNPPQNSDHDSPAQNLSSEQVKEAFDVARNSIKLLSTVLSSSPQQDALQDELTSTLVQQCRESHITLQRIVETAGDNETVIFEALNLNDELLKALSKYEGLRSPPPVVQSEPKPATIPAAVEPEDSPRGSEEQLVRRSATTRAKEDDDMMDDLDEMIFGKKDGSSFAGQNTKTQQQQRDDLISL